MWRSAAAVALLAFVAAASAQSAAFTTEPFPYSSCIRAKRASTYSIEPSVTQSGSKICWTLGYSRAQCTAGGKCCNTDIHKFELDINVRCNVQSFAASATLNGKAIRDPDVRTPPNADPKTQAILYVNGLNISGPSVDNKVLCVTLEEGPCLTLKSLIPDPTWAAALGDSTHDCCPPRSPPPRPPPTCSVCYTFKNVYADGTTGFPYFKDTANCGIAKEVFANLIESEDVADWISKGFDKPVCKDNTFKVCGTFVSVAAGTQFADYIAEKYDGGSNLIYEIYGQTPGQCPASLDDQTMLLESDPEEGCGALAATTPACAPPPPPPFPTCPSPCNNVSASMIFEIGSRITTKKGGGVTGVNATTYYCVDVTTTDAINPNNYCGRVTSLRKVEFYLDYELRWKIKSAAIYAKGKRNVWPISWGPKAQNTLKLTRLDWTESWIKANTPQVCLEVREADASDDWAGTLEAMVPADANGRVFTAAFDIGNACCPVYQAAEF
ncbi:hypothetical protein HYH03_011798 [Edaphochlamys debaryana]|uniref:Pherophorin domain-containing protein n=1 Tax=Edaphochlamys debaryana TaxID=47281 RepID=A0A835XTX8_9CHLO|nr:hypothetical protein HYH03_011798 [Edaphochlamys debaryana]|eukprot:KAG2489689.1 hypothetical protein HYH03_011798 [Edaphochlamys debaryana]